MSQSVTTPSGQSFGTVNGGMPKASRVYSFSVTLVPGVTNIVDLRTLMINKMVQDVQGIYLDNSDNTAACTVQTSTGQKITWAGGYQGQTPIYVSSQNPVFYFTGNGTVNVSLNNFPTPAQFWSAAGNGLPVVGGKVQVSDPILDALATASGLLTINKPATLTLVPLDISSVTTGGVAVTALNAGNRTAGGFIQNPINATVNLGINEINTATGTVSSANTTFIIPGQSYILTPSNNAVSVISSDSAHSFSGFGLQ